MDPKKTSLADVAIGDILSIGAAMSTPNMIADGKPYVALPDGWKLHDLSAYLPEPMRAAGSVAFADAESFIRYTNKHKDTAGNASAARRGIGQAGGAPEAKAADKDDAQTIILVDLLQSKFRVIFDHHASDAPGWSEFGATYDCPLSKEWQAWITSSGKRFDQESFAFFIEQQMLDIVDPPGATMLEVVTTLKTAKSVVFDSGIRLQDGQTQLKYHEDNTSKAGQTGQLVIPEKIKIGIPVYVGGPAYEVICNFRYRIDGGKIAMWYDILRPERILEDSLSKVITKIETGTEMACYRTTNTATPTK